MNLHNWKIVRVLAVILGLAAAATALATSDDVQFGSGSTLVINGLEIQATGNLESIVVSSANTDVAITSNLTFTSNDKTTFSYGGGGITTTFTCGGSSSALSMNGGGSMPVTPTGSTCTNSGGGGGGGGGATPTPTPTPAVSSSSGGSSSATPTPKPTPAAIAAGPTPSPTVIAISTPVAISVPAGVSPKFTFGFGKGTSGAHVKRLQQLLNADSDTRVSASGVGSPGKETNTFGPLTANAVRKFQEKYGIAKPGDPGYGFVGPKTRAKIDQVFSGAAQPVGTPSPASVQSAPVNQQAQIQIIQAQISALLEQLKKLQGQQ